MAQASAGKPPLKGGSTQNTMSSGISRGDATGELQGSSHMLYAGERVLEGSASVLNPGTQQQLNEMQS